MATFENLFSQVYSNQAKYTLAKMCPLQQGSLLSPQ